MALFLEAIKRRCRSLANTGALLAIVAVAAVSGNTVHAQQQFKTPEEAAAASVFAARKAFVSVRNLWASSASLAP